MAIEIQRNSNFVERRRSGRGTVMLDISFRERGRSAVSAKAEELSILGCRVTCGGLAIAGAPVWVGLPGLQSLGGQVIWSDGARIGIAFDHPMHPAVTARFFAPQTEPSLKIDTQAPISSPLPANDELLSRREQIVQGIVETERSPLQKRKARSQTGFGIPGCINRQVSRTADHRHEPRYADAVSTGPCELRVRGFPAEVRNVSASGLRVQLPFVPEIGQTVPVEFEGFEPYDGKVVWLRGDEAGIALPPQTIELCER